VLKDDCTQMTMIGTRLGPYEITAAIGAGGMGEVYRGRDATLNRDVAIKVLPATMAADVEGLARFKREAQLLASLSHANIAHVYGFEAAPLPDGSIAHFLAMELVEGEDLAQRLRRGAIPVDEAMAIAKQIAEGLEEAHEHGIIHRDLKPANIKVTLDGKVKILDFGLAKAMEGDPSTSAANSQLSHSPTMSRHMTEAGMIMGTAAYMSPEQARGKAVDKRADIWAFGVVLFEMLTGRRLFTGETVSDTLAAVLREEVPWTRLPPDTPGTLVRLLHRCLARDPKQRLHSAADVRIEIEEVKAGPVDPAPAGRVGSSLTGRGPWILVVALALLLAGVLLRSLSSPTAETVVTRVKMEVAPDEPLPVELGANAVLSPDGRTIVVVTTTQGTGTRLSVRPLDQLDSRPLSGTEDARSPFFSPDGRWIGFETPTGLMKVGVAGGAPAEVVDVGANPGRGATWGGNQIVFARINTGLFRVSDTGGEPTPLTTLDAARSERSHRWPSFLPGGEVVIFMVQHTGQNYDDADIEAVSLADGRRTVLVRGGAFPRYAEDGYLLFVRASVLYGLRFDPRSLKVEEPATPVLEDLMGYTGNEALGDGSAEISLSERGDLLYRFSAKGDSGKGSDLVWVDDKGQETPAFHESIYITSLEISPDGHRVAFDGRSARGQGIFIKDLERGPLTPLTTDGAGELSPAWSPDGRRLAYTPRSSAPNIRIRSIDGGEAELDLPGSSGTSGVGATSWLADGSAVVGGQFFPSTQTDLFLFPVDRGPPRSLVSLAGTENYGRVSPNGRWLALQSDEKGRNQVFVTSLLQPGPRLQVSVRGGGAPRWSRDGRLLYFIETPSENEPGPIMVVSVSEDAGSLRFGPVRQASSLRQGISAANYDIHPDGRIMVIKRLRASRADNDSSHAILVAGWRRELLRRMNDRK
jgi:Tol biopolymer transport system component